MTLVLRSQEVAQASRRDQAGEIEAGMAEWPCFLGGLSLW